MVNGEVRTTSSTGGEKGVKPEEYSLIPWDAMDEVARVYAFGAEKYASHNWRKGYEWSKSFSSLCRHIFAFWRGDDRDPESGLSHLAHAAFHVLGMLSFWLDPERYGQFDDRYYAPDQGKRAGEERTRVAEGEPYPIVQASELPLPAGVQTVRHLMRGDAA